MSFAVPRFEETDDAHSFSHRILITGGTGFVGTRLRSMLSEKLPTAALCVTGVSEQTDVGRNQFAALDVTDRRAVFECVRSFKPTVVYHLAAVSAVTSSFACPVAAWTVNTMGTLNVADALQEFCPSAYQVFVSSAEVYGRSTFAGEPVSETTLLQPANPYAASKAAADLMVQEIGQRGLVTTVIRPFNHTGAGQSDSFVVPSVCKQIAKIEAGQADPILLVGELDDERDFLDVDDVVGLYCDLLTRSTSLKSGEVYNLASGIPRRIGDIVEVLCSMAQVPIEITVDPERLRPTRVPRVVGSAAKARQDLGWEPAIPFERTLSAALTDWRERIRAGWAL